MPHTGVRFLFFFFFFSFLFCIETEPIINISVVIFLKMNSKGILHMRISILLQLPSHPGSHMHQAEFPTLYSRPLLLIHFIYFIYLFCFFFFCLSKQTEQCVHVHPKVSNYPCPTPSPDNNHKFILYVYEYLSVV